jgi:hypothetical protein
MSHHGFLSESFSNSLFVYSDFYTRQKTEKYSAKFGTRLFRCPRENSLVVVPAGFWR